ncbi:MAG: DUF4332 domain-containing protein [Candidatus Limnocylindrales bacterium]
MKIEDLEGVGETMGAKLRAAGIETTDDMLMAGATSASRDKVAAATGLSGKLILEWTNHVDLMRIPGVGSEYSDLLEAAGVDSPGELANRNAANLATTFQELDAARPNMVRRVPSEATIEGWIADAKKLPKAVDH